MITLGIDLASQPKRTAACLVDWAGPTVAVLDLGFGDEALLGLIARADKTGIDAPLGWPVDFVRAVHDDVWPDDPAGLVHRTTDRWIRAMTKKVPLSVSTDRIAYCAMRAARILAGVDGVDRSGVEGPVCEVYPDPSLLRFGLRERGAVSYKREAIGAREAIVARLPAWIGDDHREACVRSDDVLDALVCTLVARATALGLTHAPPAGVLDVARAEGWIHLPRFGSLGRL